MAGITSQGHASAQEPGSARPTVLVVEDDPFIALDLEDVLRGAGFRVIGPCATADEALALAESESPDCATLDYLLGGGQTSRPVAEALEAAGVPFVLVTATPKAARQCACFEDAPLLGKPFGADAVVETARDLLAA